MPPVQDGDEGMSQIGVYLPTNIKEALFQLAHERSEPRDNVTASGLAREYITDALAEEAENGDVPGEVADLLDDDLVANAGDESTDEEVSTA